jgi:predicted ATPase/DNA-binding SARP family transcriptional activator/Tfp pilus assembly protein PilF
MLELNLLGPTAILQDGKPLKGLQTRKTEAMLIYLACSTRAHAREWLADFFWDDRPPDQALANLRANLSRLRKALSGYLLSDRQTVAIDLSQSLVVDCLTFETEVRGLIGSFRSQPEKMDEADYRQLSEGVQSYQGEFLTGFSITESRGFDEWASLQRERYRRLAIDAFDLLLRYARLNGLEQEAVDFAQHLVQLDPLAEGHTFELMDLLARAGQPQQALQYYRAYQQNLDRELDLQPGPDIRQLNIRVAASIRESKDNLPILPTPFVGRVLEVATLKALLTEPEHSIVTLVGPGGTGKSRLAIECCVQLLREPRLHYLNGVRFISLAPLKTAAAVPFEIARQLDLKLLPSADPQEQVIRQLADREMLLTLDNFEHLISDSAAPLELVNAILARCPDVCVLVTSRVRLNLPGERIINLAGMAVQDDSEAVQLFINHAQRHSAGFEVDRAAASAIRLICNMLGGSPLGIEMAASWTRILSPADIAEQLETSLAFLVAPATAPARHRSLETIFDTSWTLLEPEEQAMLAQLSHFQGGFDRAAARRVAQAGFADLSNLVDNSFLRVDDRGRFDFHPLLQQFAHEHLLANPAAFDQSLDRFCQYFSNLIESWESTFWTTAMANALAGRVSDDYQNIIAAWDAAIERQDQDVLNRLIGIIYPYSVTIGRFKEAKDLYEQAAEQLHQAADPFDLLRARLDARLANLCRLTGEFVRARTLFESSIMVFERHGHTRELGFSLAFLAVLKHQRGQSAEADRNIRQALALMEQLQDPGGQAFCFNLLGILAQFQGDYQASGDFYQRNLEIRQREGDDGAVAIALNNLGNLANAQGQEVRARELYEASHAVFMKIGDPLGMATTIGNAGVIAWQLGDFTAAERFHKESLEIKRELGNPLGSGVSLNNLGDVALSQMEYARSARYYHEALQIFRQLQSFAWLLEATAGASKLLAQLGRTQESARFLAVILGHPAFKEESRLRAASVLADLGVSVQINPTTDQDVEAIVDEVLDALADPYK